MSIATTFLARWTLAAGFMACIGSAAAFQQTTEATGLAWLDKGQGLSDAPGPAAFGTADVERELQHAGMDRIGSLPVSCHGRRQHGVLYHVRKLPIGGTLVAEAYALNDAGLVVGYTGSAVDMPARPTLWAGARRYDLGTPAGEGGIAYGIGDAGAVVGSVGIPGRVSATAAALWYKGVRYTLRSPDFNNPDNFDLLTSALAINRAGTIVGNVHTVASDDDRPVVWRRGMPRLLPPLVSTAIARAINDVGFVVGDGDYPGGVLRRHALLWTPDGRVVELDTQAVLDSRAYDVNNKGKIVGTAEPLGAEIGGPAVWYRGRRTALSIPAGIGGAARAINERDQIVGFQGRGLSNPERALTWYGSTGYQLDTLLDDESRGIVINDALDINDRGQILATTVLPNGRSQPLLLTPRPCYRR
ncbi:MAG: hypothetical protein AB1437_19805 [Pseudomonadota bacterium]